MVTRYGNVNLYEEDNPYETIRHYAVIGEDWIEMHGDTSEKAPGGRYGRMNRVEGMGFLKLKEALDVDAAGLAQAIAREFSGERGLMAFLEFCLAHDIEVKCYIS